MSSKPDWWEPRKDRNRRSRAQEKRRAEQMGGRATAGSGSSWRQPQDVRTPDALEQLKFTDKASATLKVADLEKLAIDAARQGRAPRMIIDFEQHGLRAVVEVEAIPRRR